MRDARYLDALGREHISGAGTARRDRSGNRCVTVWRGNGSRAGYEARLGEKRREAAGEVWTFEVGDWSARVYPTGRLAVMCARLRIDCADLAGLPKRRQWELGVANPALVEIMRRAGWSVD